MESFMRIDQATLGVQPPENSKTGRAVPTGAAGIAAGSVSGSASGTDQTQFSFDPARVEALTTQALAQPEIRGARVQALQQAIGNGEYSVSPRQVADALAGDLAG